MRLVLALVLLVAPAAHAATRLPSRPARPYVPGELLVAYAPGAVNTARDGRAVPASASLAAALADLGLARAENVRRASGPATRRIEIVRYTSDQPGFDPVAAADALRGRPGVLAVAPNLNLTLDVVPNDPWLPYQWPFNSSAASIHAPLGWNHTTGSPGVKIAIIDTGVDLGHPDLASKIWTNPGEIPGNGIDDDGDGYIDDVHGWDFGDGDADPDPVPVIDAATEIDIGWHGTFVSGLAAAASNDGVGIAGVAWNCPIMPLKVSDAASDIPLSAVTAAMDYAIAKGASVVNMSLGSADPAAQAFFQPLVTEAFTAGIVVVGAAGNDGTDELNFPAACDSAVSVASTNASNVRSSFSNWGPSVDLCAPGEATWSSIARNYTYDDWSLTFFEYLWYYNDTDPYMQNDGTSFSAPLVTGAVALLRSQSPGLGPQQVRDRLVATGDVKSYDNPIGPKLNLDRLLSNPLAVAPGGSSALAFGPPTPNPASRSVAFAFTLPRAGRIRFAILDAAGREVRMLADGERGAGEQSAAWDLRDRAGAEAPAGLYFARIESEGLAKVRRLAVIR
jgi:subtilisin family serine protease